MNDEIFCACKSVFAHYEEENSLKIDFTMTYYLRVYFAQTTKPFCCRK